MSERVDKITIQIKGLKKYRQLIGYKVYEVYVSDEFLEIYLKPGNGMEFNSSIEPSEEVI